MSFDIFIKLRHEERFLPGILGACMGAAGAFTLSAARDLIQVVGYDLALRVFTAYELVFASLWIILVAYLMVWTYRLERAHPELVNRNYFDNLNEAERGGRLLLTIRDLLTFYRSHYKTIVVILTTTIGISLLTIVSGISLYSLNYINFNDAFQLSVGSAVLIPFPIVILVIVSMIWRSKLHKVKDFENKLQEMLGGSIEA